MGKRWTPPTGEGFPTRDRIDVQEVLEACLDRLASALRPNPTVLRAPVQKVMYLHELLPSGGVPPSGEIYSPEVCSTETVHSG